MGLTGWQPRGARQGQRGPAPPWSPYQGESVKFLSNEEGTQTCYCRTCWKGIGTARAGLAEMDQAELWKYARNRQEIFWYMPNLCSYLSNYAHTMQMCADM